MPTPIKVFAELAAKYGDVNTDDAEALEKWFNETLPSLKPEQIEEILETLLRHDGTDSIPSGERSYPVDVPLPSLKDSPPASLPFFAAVVELLKKFWEHSNTIKK